MKTPILFLIFNRPDTTEQVFAAIREARPPKLYIAADGARAAKGESEAELCRQTRALVVDNIDWPCEVKTRFLDSNLGCGLAVSGAIKWFFDNEPQGIILEDDVLPHADFFAYCEELLERYATSDEVFFIGGNNFDSDQKEDASSYYFSAYEHVWGWAAWRKTIERYSYDLSSFTLRGYLRAMFKYRFSFKEQLHAAFIFMLMKMGRINTWDYQLVISLQMAGKLAIVPSHPLIKNIGIGPDATHTTKSDEQMQNREFAPIMPLSHPEKIIRRRDLDKAVISNKLYFRALPIATAKLWVKYLLWLRKAKIDRN